jgi:hypothetical protein
MKCLGRLINPNQLQNFGLTVSDVFRQFDQNSTHSISVPQGGKETPLQVLLEMKGNRSPKISCSCNTITDIVHTELAQYVNNMPFFQQGAPPNDENADPNVCQPATEQANSALTAIELKDIFKSMMSEFKNVNRRGGREDRIRTPLPPAQGTDSDGNKTTYCWSHGITTNLRLNGKGCKRPKEGHKEEATLQNKMGGNTELVKNNRRNNNN